MRRIALFSVCFILFQQLDGQYFNPKFGYTKNGSNNGWNVQLNYNRFLSDDFGIVSVVAASFIDKDVWDGNYQLLVEDDKYMFHCGVFYQVLNKSKHSVLSQAAVGLSYLSYEDAVFYSPYLSLDYFYRVSSRSHVGFSLGVMGGKMGYQFYDIAYRFDLQGVSAGSSDLKSSLMLLLESNIVLAPGQ